ncbi:MAG: hypothetical protein ABIF19_18215 [Planctomycetota bacterium]
MEFTLKYEGLLRANGSVKDKQALRRAFHSQLRELTLQPPFSNRPDSGLVYDDNEREEPCCLFELSGFNFRPLISVRMKAIAELDIIMLRPEPPGAIVTQAGDIDNRLKTLLDSLRIPQSENAIPKGDSPADSEAPFFCLLEDDNLITKLMISTDRLLQPGCDSSFVSLLIRVKTKVLFVTCRNIDLA